MIDIWAGHWIKTSLTATAVLEFIWLMVLITIKGERKE